MYCVTNSINILIIHRPTGSIISVRDTLLSVSIIELKVQLLMVWSCCISLRQCEKRVRSSNYLNITKIIKWFIFQIWTRLLSVQLIESKRLYYAKNWYWNLDPSTLCDSLSHHVHQSLLRCEIVNKTDKQCIYIFS